MPHDTAKAAVERDEISHEDPNHKQRNDIKIDIGEDQQGCDNQSLDISSFDQDDINIVEDGKGYSFVYDEETGSNSTPPPLLPPLLSQKKMISLDELNRWVNLPEEEYRKEIDRLARKIKGSRSSSFGSLPDSLDLYEKTHLSAMNYNPDSPEHENHPKNCATSKVKGLDHESLTPSSLLYAKKKAISIPDIENCVPSPLPQQLSIDKKKSNTDQQHQHQCSAPDTPRVRVTSAEENCSQSCGLNKGRPTAKVKPNSTRPWSPHETERLYHPKCLQKVQQQLNCSSCNFR